MSSSEITESVLALPEADRLQLARRIIESVAAEHCVADLIPEGARRIEEVLSGKIPGLSEDEYRRAIG